MRRKEKEFKSPLTAFQLLERIIVKDSVQLLDIANLLKNGKPVLLSFELLDVQEANKMIGFLSGVVYALEGSVFVAGSSVQWLRDGLRFFEDARFSEIYATRIASCDGVYVVPAFVGLGTPYWDNDARGAVFGLTRGTKKEHFINATVESIAYQTKDVLDAMEASSNVKIKTMGVDGGACVNSYLMQFQADLLNVTLKRPICKETTALGATYICGLKVGLFASKEEVSSLHLIDSMFTSSMNDVTRNKLVSGWKKAVNATLQYK